MTVKTIAQFVRFPAGFSAASNIIAAYVIVKHGQVVLPELIAIVFASLCLYFAGMGLNDCFDYYEDRALRSNRPLPSGRLGLSKAWAISLGLLVTGCISAFLVDLRSGFVSLVLCMLIILYNSKVLSPFFGAITMGLCRYSNWMMALILEPVILQTLILPLPLMLYVSGITLLSQAETGEHSLSLIKAAIVFKLFALAVMLGLIFVYSSQIVISLLIVAGVAVYIGSVYQPVWQNLRPTTVQNAVMKLVMCVIVIDAVVLLILAYPIAAACVLLMLFAGRLLGRKLYVS